MLTFDFEGANGNKTSFNNKLDDQIDNLIHQANIELDSPVCDYDNIILNINEALSIAEISSKELSWLQKQSIHNLLKLTKDQATEKFETTDPIKFCLITSDIRKIIEKIDDVDEEILEQERVRKATIHDGDVAFKSLLNGIRRKTFTTKEALAALLEINEETSCLQNDTMSQTDLKSRNKF